MGVPMEGFFDGVDVVFATPAPSTTAYKAPAKAPTPSAESVPRKEGTHTEGVGETTPLPAKTLASPKRAIYPAAAQTKTARSVLPLVISTSDPFTVISQVAKGGVSLVITPSSIPGSATHGPDTDLSSEEFDDILEDPDDVSILKKRISPMKRGVPRPSLTSWVCIFPPLLFLPFFYVYLRFICTPIFLLAETFEGLGIAAGVGMPAPATPVAPIPVAPLAPF